MTGRMALRRRAVLQGLCLGLAAPALAQSASTRTLRFVPQSNLPTLDPMFSSGVVTNHGFYVFDTLYATDLHGVTRPQMADGHTVSGDGLVWRIRLRDGLVFHDGQAVRAVDCAESLRRWSKLNALGKIAATAVVDWGAADDRTVEIRLSRPFPLLLDAIARAGGTTAFVMPERLARTDAFKPIAEMIGSGPYRFVADEFVSGSRVVYERFDRYRPRDEPADGAAGGKRAYFPRVEWQVIPDASTANAALLRGEVDWWELPSPDFYPALKANPGITLQLDDPAGKVSFMRLNHLQPPFDDVQVRRAVLAGVRQEDYMQVVLGDDPDLWRRCHSQFPCGSPYQVDDDSAMPGNLDTARRLLRGSGYTGGKAVILAPTDNPLIAPFGDLTADLLGKIGIATELATSDWATVVQRRSNQEPVGKGGWSVLYSYGSSEAYALPALNYLLRGEGSGGWFGWWTSPEAEQLVANWLSTSDPDARISIGRSLGQLAMREVATVPLGQWFGRTAFRRTITGVMPGMSPYPWNVRPV